MIEQRVSVSSLLRLRCVVAVLGETNRWWRSTFLSPTGLSFLQRIYSRTFVAAAIRSASEAARVEHDARIGQGQAVHLFRLPVALEHALGDSLREWDYEAQAKWREQLIAPGGPLVILRELATGQKPYKGEGPVNCGPASQLGKAPIIALLAAQYLGGFEGGRRVYPYFEAGK